MTATDVVVVGGGPAGLAAAIALRLRGFEVLVADRARPPIDKPCGEGLMPDGVAALNRLGISGDFAGALPFGGIRFKESGVAAEGCFSGDHGLGIRRTALHQRMIDRAAEVGVVMRWGEGVRVADRSGVEIGGGKISSRWVVGADGRESSVRRWAGLLHPTARRRRIGLRQHFRIAPWTDLVEVEWHDRGQAVVTPLASDEICVSLFTSDAGSRFPDLVGSFPELHQRLLGAVPLSAPRGAISGSSVMRSVVTKRVALIGDAAGAVDALTGEGLALSFKHALALADAIARGDLRRFERAHRRISRPPELMAELMLMAGGRRNLRRRVLTALAAQPRLFTFMLGVHAGGAPLTAAPLGAIAGFIRHLITAESLVQSPVAG
jgi:flavin-dependent dehydrogenase